MNDLTVGLFIDEVISGVTDVDDLYLEHHGVKGMKWGVLVKILILDPAKSLTCLPKDTR